MNTSKMATKEQQRSDLKKNRSCRICGRFFRSTFCATLHYRVHEENTEDVKIFHCVICKKKFKNARAFDLHKTLHKPWSWQETESQGDDDNNAAAQEEQPEPGLEHLIEAQGDEKICQDEAIEDEQMHIPSQTDVLNFNGTELKPVSRRRRKNKSRKIVRKQQNPDIANINRSYARRMLIKTNGGIYTGEEEMKCDQCPYSTTYSNNFRRHLMSVHYVPEQTVLEMIESWSKSKRKRSSSSSKGNANQKSRRVIMSQVQIFVGKNRRYECTVCGKKFLQAGHLSEHRALHFDVRRFKCPHCEKAFSRHRSLRNHMGLMHNKANEFQCKMCKLCFTDEWQLEEHQQLHTGSMPFVCEECPKKFMSPSGLRKHRRIVHRLEKKWQCTMCDEKFRLWSEIQQHMFEHRDKPGSQCEVCKKLFESELALKKHARKYHRELFIK